MPNTNERDALIAATAALAGAASAYRTYAKRHTSLGKVPADPFFSTRVENMDRAVEVARAAATAPNADVPMGAIVNGHTYIERIEQEGFECEAGNISMCTDWQELRRCFDTLADWAMHAAPNAGAPLANRDLQLLQVENAGLQASVGHLGVMVDELRGLTQRAIKAMSTLHSAATPDESTEDIDARIPGHDFATFVNEHAALLHAFAHHADMPAAPAQQAGAPTCSAPAAWVSPEQFEAHPDGGLDGSGRYLPMRKSMAGKFTKPLYTRSCEHGCNGCDDCTDYEPTSAGAPLPLAPSDAVNVNGEPATALSLLAALIDIHDDAESAAPEDRCYVQGAWPDVLDLARKFLATPPQATLPASEPVATLRFQRGVIGHENDMPEVVSCAWLPDGVYRVYLAATRAQPQADAADAAEPVAMTKKQLDRAAQVLAYRMDYPWEHMPLKGREAMRTHAKAVIDAAQAPGAPGEGT